MNDLEWALDRIATLERKVSENQDRLEILESLHRDNLDWLKDRLVKLPEAEKPGANG